MPKTTAKSPLELQPKPKPKPKPKPLRHQFETPHTDEATPYRCGRRRQSFCLNLNLKRTPYVIPLKLLTQTKQHLTDAGDKDKASD